MDNNKRSVARTVASVTVLGLALMSQPAQAQTYKVIHRFTSVDGANPYAGLTMDAAGRLYGTTFQGGTSGQGTVFRLTPSGSSWVLSPLYNFRCCSDGAFPRSRVIFGPDGSLYSTTGAGGGGCGGSGCGTVFNLRPPSIACKAALCPWTETIVHAFGERDGPAPAGDLLFDAAGNLYGTTDQGGLYGGGEVYELTSSGGGWTENILYSFAAGSLGYPDAGVTLDKAGNLYGTTRGFQYGGVYQLTPSRAGWTENQLYVFQAGADGGLPHAGVIFDRAGNLYGGTSDFGAGLAGTVFELMPSNDGWAFSVLYSFAGYPGENGPWANLVMDAAGNLYGTTLGDGTYALGAVFKLTPSPSGWTYTSLHDFTGPEGANPYSSVIFDARGNLYGTASAGGRHDVCNGGCGVVWEITP